jgi:hypothetical protein
MYITSLGVTCFYVYNEGTELHSIKVFPLFNLQTAELNNSYLWKKGLKLAMVRHACKSEHWRGWGRRIMSLRPALSSWWIPGQSGLHSEILSPKNQREKKCENDWGTFYICVNMEHWTFQSFQEGEWEKRGNNGGDEPNRDTLYIWKCYNETPLYNYHIRIKN